MHPESKKELAVPTGRSPTTGFQVMGESIELFLSQVKVTEATAGGAVRLVLCTRSFQS